MPDTRHYDLPSDWGAENWAVLASLIETCKLHGVNPEAYLADVMTKLVANWPNARLGELTPWAWACSSRHPNRCLTPHLNRKINRKSGLS
jgi:hypothetical protein